MYAMNAIIFDPIKSIDAAIAKREGAAPTAPTAGHLGDLATLYGARYAAVRGGGRPADLTRAIELGYQALDLCGDADDRRPGILFDLADHHRQRIPHGPNDDGVDDLDEAIRRGRDACELPESAIIGPGKRVGMLVDLAKCLLARVERDGGGEDAIHEAIRIMREARRLSASGSITPSWVDMMLTEAAVLAESGRMADLDEAMRTCLELLSSGGGSDEKVRSRVTDELLPRIVASRERIRTRRVEGASVSAPDSDGVLAPTPPSRRRVEGSAYAQGVAEAPPRNDAPASVSTSAGWPGKRLRTASSPFWSRVNKREIVVSGEVFFHEQRQGRTFSLTGRCDIASPNDLTLSSFLVSNIAVTDRRKRFCLVLRLELTGLKSTLDFQRGLPLTDRRRTPVLSRTAAHVRSAQ